MKKFLDTCRRLLSIALNLFVLCAEPIALPLSWEMGQAQIFTYYTEDSNIFAAAVCTLVALWQLRCIFTGGALLEREPHLPRSDVRWALLPTLAYAAVILPLNILRVIVGPYPFFEVYHQPVYVSVLWAVGLLGVNYLYAWLLWRLGGGRPRSAC